MRVRPVHLVGIDTKQRCATRRTASGLHLPRSKTQKPRGVMYFVRAIMLSTAVMLLSFAANAQNTAAPKDAHLYFIWPTDGAVIKGAFWARFGLRNMGVTQAGSN